MKQLELQLKQLLEAHNSTVANYDEQLKQLLEAHSSTVAIHDENMKGIDGAFEQVGAELEHLQNRIKWLAGIAREDAEQWLKEGEELSAQYKYQAAVWCYEQGLQLNPNHADLQCLLGSAYYLGQGVTQDYTQAGIWWRKAAEQGNAFAECKLGDACHAGGCGVPQDQAQAVIWWRKAAVQGLAQAECQLGRAYYEGEGVPQDQAQAAIWFRKAAEQGHLFAGMYLARAYYEGAGLPQDHAQAAIWWRKAVGQGDEKDALQALEGVARGRAGLPQDSKSTGASKE